MRKKDLPRTIQRSPAKAQRTWAKTHDSAVDEYGPGERAQRTAYASLKHGFEKQGDHWEPKQRKGASDPRSRQRSSEAKRQGRGETFGGVDLYGHTKRELYERARKLDIDGRSKMDKKELARAIARKQ